MSNPVNIEKHPSERRRSAATTLCCGCCCCCCCCLHTIGSVLGAALAPTIGGRSNARAHWDATAMIPGYYDDVPEEAFSSSPRESSGTIPDLRRPAGVSSVAIFWWLTVAAIFLTFMFPLFAYRDTGALFITAIIVLLVFPGIQLASAIVTLIAFALWPRPDRTHQLKQVGKITAGIVAGSVAGILAMVAIGAAIGMFR